MFEDEEIPIEHELPLVRWQRRLRAQLPTASLLQISPYATHQQASFRKSSALHKVRLQARDVPSIPPRPPHRHCQGRCAGRAECPPPPRRALACGCARGRSAVAPAACAAAARSSASAPSWPFPRCPLPAAAIAALAEQPCPAPHARSQHHPRASISHCLSIGLLGADRCRHVRL